MVSCSPRVGDKPKFSSADGLYKIWAVSSFTKSSHTLSSVVHKDQTKF